MGETAAFKPTPINTINDVLGSTSFGGSPFNGFGLPKLTAMAEGGVSLSRLQKEMMATFPGGEVLADLSKCAYEKSLEFLAGVKGLDPRQDTAAQGVYQINANTEPGNANAVAAAVSMNALRGYSGPGVWTLGGCDYHDGTQTTGDARDGDMGVQIGRAVELAFRLKKPLFFQLLTDGGCASGENTRNWNSDAGGKGMTVVGYYHPDAPPKIKKQQVGHYTDGQGAERSTLIGSEPALVAYAVFANYLNICGKLGDFGSYAPGVFTGAGQLDSVLIFEGKAS